MIHLLTAEKPMCLWCCISVALLKSDRCERSFLTSSEMLTSTLPVVLLVLKFKTIYLEYIQQCFSTVFHLQKRRNAFSTFLQIVDIPYWILTDFDMVNLSNLEIVFYPSFHDCGLSSPRPLF